VHQLDSKTNQLISNATQKSLIDVLQGTTWSHGYPPHSSEHQQTTQRGKVEIVSDCLGALKRVTYLPPYRIPSRCCHSNILKTILVHCRGLSFTTHYTHVKLHQDDDTLFANLGQKAQLNCICDHAAKQRIAINKLEGPVLGRMFPLKSIGLFVNSKKIISETGSYIQFWAHHQLARDFFLDQKILSHVQFDTIDWTSVHRMLHNLP
jgi:hypothetical protein